MEIDNQQPSPSDKSMKTDYDARIRIRYLTDDDKTEEDSVFAHRIVLSTFSTLFHQLLQDAASLNTSPTSSSFSEDVVSISLDLTPFPNALAAFKVVLEALYTGDIKLKSATPNEVLAVSRHCQIPNLEQKIMSAAATSPLNLANILQCSSQSIPSSTNAFLQYNAPPFHNYLSNMLSLWTNPFFSALFGSTVAGPTLPFPSQSDTENSRTQSEGSSPRTNSTSTPPSTDLEKIVPNDDKEGWCRNKKYIEKVDGGFMCTVCRKIYGRYNSVSYHVTIYHRNPPIKCEENGCNFSTREARYIHFHKYYRHHIPLPENIDLGSRKCPFCRHVSKSPAMLEKHIARHETEGTTGTPGALKRAQSKKKLVPTVTAGSSYKNGSALFVPTSSASSIAIQCSLCSFSTHSTDILFIHLAMQHSHELAQSSAMLADNSSETSTSTTSSSDSEPMITDTDMDVKPLTDPSIQLHLNTPLSN